MELSINALLCGIPGDGEPASHTLVSAGVSYLRKSGVTKGDLFAEEFSKSLHVMVALRLSYLFIHC